MSRKLMILGLAVVLVAAVAIPVVAQERVVTPKLQKISKRALKKSATALRTSRTALRQARFAKQQAGAAGRTGNQAASAAAAAQATVDSTRLQRATAAGPVTTSSETFVALPGGPAVQVTVPPSGLIEVWAQAMIDAEGAVALFEDGQHMSGQADFCQSEAEDRGVLLGIDANPGQAIVVSTPAVAGIGICGSLGVPGPVLFEATPGTHTYELRYLSCGCGGPSATTFSNRRLFVAPRL
jgi:hypothetical protein